MFPVNKTYYSSFGFSLPVCFVKLMAGHCLIKLKGLYFPVDYQVWFLEYLIKLNYFFSHIVRMNWKLFQGCYFVFRITTFYMEFLIFILKQLITIPFHFTTLLSETLSCWCLVVQSCRIPKVKNFKMLGLNFSSKLDRGSYIISIAKITSKKIGALICSMKFLSPKVALYLYKSIIWPCMRYCCHVRAGAPS